MRSPTSRAYRPAIVGHRGAAALAPENTLPSFRRVVALGVEWVELDVRLTADGIPICLHDATLDRTTTGAGPVAGVTLRELRRLRVLDGGAEPASGSGADVLRVPTLAEALAAIPPPVGCLVELKQDDAREPALVRAALECIAAAAMEDRVRVISFQESLLAEARRQAPHLARGIIGSRDLEVLFAAAARLECVAIHPKASLLEDGLADRCARAGLRLNTWTVNDTEGILHAAGHRADEITTDRPDLARETLVRLGLRTEAGKPGVLTAAVEKPPVFW